MGAANAETPAAGGLRLREGQLKEPIEGVVVFALLNRVGASVTAGGAGLIGAVEALVLWVVVGYAGVAVYDATRGSEAESRGAIPGGLPDRGLAVGLTAGGAVAVVLVWALGAGSMGAWVTAVSAGPGAGVPPGASGGELVVWVIVAVAGAESLARGLDKLLVRYARTGEI